MRKFRPILFSTPMVQAILGGRKLQTRRVVKDKQTLACIEAGIMKGIETLCPYGKIGDVLWVREAFSKIRFEDDTIDYVFKADGDFYRKGMDDFEGWKPSIHMPFEAARLFLQVTNIRVERLYDINNEDAIAEGVESNAFGNYKDYCTKYKYPFKPKASFLSLWQLINGMDSYTANPWVWVIEFKRIDKLEDLK